MLLHGFPEFWYGWRKQIEPLPSPGFESSCRPARLQPQQQTSGVAAYALTELVSDVIAIADQLGQKKIFWEVRLGRSGRMERGAAPSAARGQARGPQCPAPLVMRNS